MNVLEKILEEIGVSERIRFSKYTELLIAVKDVEKIIRSHMDEMPKCNNCSRCEWYRIGYRDGRRINVKNIKSINKEMGDYLFEKYCVEGFDEELDKIFYKYLALGGDMDVSSNYKSIEDAEIDPVSEEFLKDCAETAAKYKRNDDSWIPETCKDCPFHSYAFGCRVKRKVFEGFKVTRPDWCPIEVRKK